MVRGHFTVHKDETSFWSESKTRIVVEPDGNDYLYYVNFGIGQRFGPPFTKTIPGGLKRYKA